MYLQYLSVCFSGVLSHTGTSVDDPDRSASFVVSRQRAGARPSEDVERDAHIGWDITACRSSRAKVVWAMSATAAFVIAVELDD